MTAKNAAYWIRALDLEPHPEGGFYRQTFRSALILPKPALPGGFEGGRPASTAIYFLLEQGNFSAFHRLRSDEHWHFYSGSPLLVHQIAPGGRCSQTRLGPDPDAGEHFQAVVPAGIWFASELAPGKLQTDAVPYALVGCTVAPGFDFGDFELATGETLANIYPQHRDLIVRLTRS